MKTRITSLFGIEQPIILPGMSLVSVPKLVAAVSNAGGLGILATGPLSAEETRRSIGEIRALTDKPFGVGVTLMMPGANENIEVALSEKVPVINFSLGKGDWIVKRAHAYGGKVIASVVNERHALAAERYGVDALLATGHEAAAHGGAVTSLVLIPTLADAVDIPVIGTGGFADGRGLVAALALGAEGIAMGSRFAITQESPVHQNTKQAVLQKNCEDTLYTAKFDGMDCRIMKSARAEQASKGKIHFIRAIKNATVLAKRMQLHWFKLFTGALLQGPGTVIRLARAANATESLELAIHQGDCDNGVYLSGQVQGRINDIPSVAEVMERVLNEADECATR